MMELTHISMETERLQARELVSAFPAKRRPWARARSPDTSPWIDIIIISASVARARFLCRQTALLEDC